MNLSLFPETPQTPTIADVRKSYKVPETSLEAYHSMQTHLEGHYAKIIESLGSGACNYEVIALRAGMDRHQVGRRLSELELKGMVRKTGTKSLTKSGRNAFDYQLIEK